nr:mast cell protease 1A-like [Pelodiscus sinensis]|eukprot:XP_025046092.1 mast cell protease 1A-like [Pelodiscus sinensis]
MKNTLVDKDSPRGAYAEEDHPALLAGEIVGGWEARPHSRPYMAFLRIQHVNATLRCGGFLVEKNFVLTAAHCQGEKITVTLGAHNIAQREQSQQVIPVRRQIPHPQYDKETLNNDIMLLQLQMDAELNSPVGTIKLPRANEEVKPRTLCTVAGWGSLRPDAVLLPDTLREVDVVVMPDAACPRNPDWLYRGYDPATMMCVGDPAQFYDSAQGDSGGPLVCGEKAWGIVSWGYCKAPGVYTKISAFVPWINNTMRRLQLQMDAELNSPVGTIKLPRANEEVKPRTLCTVAGWGSLRPDAVLLPDTLREVDVVVMPDAACPRNPDWLYRGYDPATMMCVGDPAQFYDSAQGDSGGPLVCGEKAWGIVSWGYCKAPGVYTKISAFVPWIRKTIGRLQAGARL